MSRNEGKKEGKKGIKEDRKAGVSRKEGCQGRKEGKKGPEVIYLAEKTVLRKGGMEKNNQIN